MTYQGKIVDYWDSYYAGGSLDRIPSQFATFVVNEFSAHMQFVDIGCGNGRDTFFFAQHQKQVIGADKSEAAIETNGALAAKTKIPALRFTQLDLSDADSCAAFAGRHAEHLHGAVIYARFLLHAIDEMSQKNLFEMCARVMGPDARFCVEFRTNRDENLAKVTEHHYRRFISPVQASADLAAAGLKVEYFCEGFGLAKYKTDDAHVARMILAAA